MANTLSVKSRRLILGPEGNLAQPRSQMHSCIPDARALGAEHLKTDHACLAGVPPIDPPKTSRSLRLPPSEVAQHALPSLGMRAPARAGKEQLKLSSRTRMAGA